MSNPATSSQSEHFPGILPYVAWQLYAAALERLKCISMCSGVHVLGCDRGHLHQW